MTVTSDPKNTKKRKIQIAIGLVAVVAAAAAIGAGTYAAFSDTESGPGGTISAGTLDLTVGDSGNAELFSATNLVPGQTKDVTITVNNVGNTPGNLTGTLSMSGKDNICTEPEQVAEGTSTCATGGNLQDQMTVTVLSTPSSTTPGSAQPIKTFVQAGLSSVPLAGNTSGQYKLRFTLPDLSGTTNNAVQGDSVTINSTFDLVQS